MKNKMPLDGLGLGHDSGSVHCDMLKMLCFRTAWGGLLRKMFWSSEDRVRARFHYAESRQNKPQVNL